ncbi:aminotransferase class I/II-fold pyridoxal phosphate-dependent enzyme [Dactylosporangium sp. CA-139066]|uniref:aminotransferase class I/II-fold pyridoxal phosphate-dependent enzyme n=1 Tax=Dactylosporangium sp. CA-139066 TaxID=3239930 RepID=UPI003D8B8920
MSDLQLLRTLQRVNATGYARRRPATDTAGGLDLAVGEARYPLPAPVRAELTDTVARLDRIWYADPAGELALRTAYLRHVHAAAPIRPNGAPADSTDAAELADRVLVTAGGKEAAWLAMRYLLHRFGRQGVLAPQPGWEPYQIWAHGLDVPVLGYHPAVVAADPQRLRDVVAAARVRPSVLVLNYPHNPTGVSIDQPTMDDLLAVAADLDLAVVSDEVYRWFAAEPVSAMFAPDYDPARHLVVDSTSKWLTTAGLRVGFLLADASITGRLTAFRATYASCTSVVDQRLAVQLLSAPATTAWLGQVRADVDQTRDETVKLLVDLGVTVVSHGALYIWCASALDPDTQPRDAPTTVPARLTPGGGFGAAGRVRLCTARAGLDPAAAAAAVRAALRGADA